MALVNQEISASCVVEIVGSLLKQYAYQAPESTSAVFTQYYTEEEFSGLAMKVYSAEFEYQPFYQGTEDQA